MHKALYILAAANLMLAILVFLAWAALTSIGFTAFISKYRYFDTEKAIDHERIRAALEKDESFTWHDEADWLAGDWARGAINSGIVISALFAANAVAMLACGIGIRRSQSAAPRIEGRRDPGVEGPGNEGIDGLRD